MDSLYYGNGGNVRLASTQKAFAISDEVIERALHNIYRRRFNPKTDIDPTFFHAFVSTLNAAADKGMRQAPTPDDDFIQALRHNNAVFAAFKTHRLQNDVARRLLDSNGNLKPFEQWKNDVQGITSHQCKAWLRTEYDTAVRNYPVRKAMDRIHIALQGLGHRRNLCTGALIFDDDVAHRFFHGFFTGREDIIGKTALDAELDVTVGYAVELSDFFLKLLGAGSAVNA